MHDLSQNLGKETCWFVSSRSPGTRPNRVHNSSAGFKPLQLLANSMHLQYRSDPFKTDLSAVVQLRPAWQGLLAVWKALEENL